jgi:tetratricopeptide (TPR) repeat protein
LAKLFTTKKTKIMKKFFVLILAVCISIGAAAQMGKVTAANSFIDQGALDKAKEAIDVALVNEKSMTNPKTFLAKGRLCQEVFKSDNPKFKALYANPLEEAYAAYEKANQLDPKGTIKNQMKLNNTYGSLGNDYIVLGAQLYEAKDFEGALKAFEQNLKISTSELYIGVADSAIYFNAGLAAYNGKMYDKAIPYFKKCTEIKYEAINSYLLEFQSYMLMEDKANAEATLQRAFKAFPDNQDLLLNLVDFYMKNDKLDDAFSYINLAKSKDPNNYSLYWAEGVLYMKQEKFTEAIVSLTKSVEINGEMYETQYNLAVCYYNKAVEMLQKANEIMDAAKYNVAAAEANAVFISAIPYFEKASSLKPDDTDALKNLKELYFRLRNVKPEYETKYNEIVKKLEGK